jgi:hypothetical protein
MYICTSIIEFSQTEYTYVTSTQLRKGKTTRIPEAYSSLF